MNTLEKKDLLKTAVRNMVHFRHDPNMYKFWGNVYKYQKQKLNKNKEK